MISLEPSPLRPARPAQLPVPVPRPDDVVRRQRIRQRRARVRRPRADRLEGRPGPRPRGALASAGDLPARGGNLGRPPSTTPRDGRLEPGQRPQSGRDRGPPAERSGRGLAPAGARSDQRAQLGLLLPGRERNRPADRPAKDAAAGERDPPPGPERELDRWSRARRPRGGGDEPRRRDRGRRRDVLLRCRSPGADPDSVDAEDGGVELLHGARRRLARVQLSDVALGDRPPVRLRERNDLGRRGSPGACDREGGSRRRRGLGPDLDCAVSGPGPRRAALAPRPPSKAIAHRDACIPTDDSVPPGPCRPAPGRAC